MDPLGSSNHSLEEWLKASGTNEGTKTNSSKKHEKALISDVGHSFHASAEVGAEKPRNDVTSSLAPPRDGRRSISPIDSDTSDLGGVGNGQDQPFWQPPSLVPTNKPLSAKLITDEERFDEEYGELFDVQRNSTIGSQGYEVEFGHEDSDLELSGQAAEQQRLLPESDGRLVSRYDSVETEYNAQETIDPRRGNDS